MKDYNWKQPPESKLFWESVFKRHYKGHYKNLEWYEDGHMRDVADKIDCDVVLVNGLKAYQLKDQETEFKPKTINLNIAVFDRYYKGNYGYDGFAIGILWDNSAILIEANAMMNVWDTYNEVWKKTYCKDMAKLNNGSTDANFLAIPYNVFVSVLDHDSFRTYNKILNYTADTL